jgi:hypothetical protein
MATVARQVVRKRTPGSETVLCAKCLTMLDSQGRCLYYFPATKSPHNVTFPRIHRGANSNARRNKSA